MPTDTSAPRYGRVARGLNVLARHAHPVNSNASNPSAQSDKVGIGAAAATRWAVVIVATEALASPE